MRLGKSFSPDEFLREARLPLPPWRLWVAVGRGLQTLADTAEAKQRVTAP